jgi:hypothetical protein
MIHPQGDSIHSWPNPRRSRLAPKIGFSTGDIVAIMPTAADASRAVGALAGLGIADTSIEAGESLGEPVILVVRRPGRERIADIRGVLLAHQARRARYFRVRVIEELVRSRAGTPA